MQYCRTITLLALLSPFLVAQAGQTIKEGSLTDHDYRIRVKAPPGWKMSSYKKARKLNPKAIIAATGRYGANAIVLVEQVSQGDLKGLSKLILDQTAIQDRVNELNENFTLGEIPAVRNVMSGRIGALRLRFQHTFFFAKGHIFQIMCWNRKARVRPDGTTFQSFVDAFEILEGPIRRRVWKRTAPDAVGVGWRIKNNKFESAPFAIGVKPLDRWRLAIGTELFGMNEEAIVGLTHDESYIAITCERAHGVDKKSFIELKQPELSGDMTLKPGSLSARAFGQDIQFNRYTFTFGIHFEFLVAGLFIGDTFVGITAWHQVSDSVKAVKYLKRALPGFRTIGKVEASALAKELESSIPSRREKGPGYALRDGVWRDYNLGLVWKRPKGFWKLSITDAARSQNPDACMILEHPESGLMASVIIESLKPPVKAEAHHKVAVENTGGTVLSSKSMKKGNRPMLLSRILLDGKLSITYLLHTLVVEDRHIQISIWGYSGNLKASPEVVAEILASLKLL